MVHGFSWVLLKMKELGQTAGVGLCFHPRRHFGYHVLSHGQLCGFLKPFWGGCPCVLVFQGIGYDANP